MGCEIEDIGEVCRSGDDEFQGCEAQVGGSFGQMEHFDTGDLVGFVVVEDDAGRDFLGFDDGGVGEAEEEGVGFFVDEEFLG